MSDSYNNIVMNEPTSFHATQQEVIIPKFSRFSRNKPGSGVKHNTEFMQCFVGIGADNYAVLTMSIEAWVALQDGAGITTMTGDESGRK